MLATIPAELATVTARPPTWRHALAGARAMAPWLLGVAPFGLVIGISAAESDLPMLAAWLTGPLIYSGSAQVATIHLLDAGAAPLAVVLAALVINLRLVLYSATMAPHWRDAPRGWQALAGYLLVDPSLAVGVEGYARTGDQRAGHLHYLGGAVALWLTWIVAITLGATVGAALPAGLHLEFVIPLFIVGELAERVSDRPTMRAVGITALVAVLATEVPLHLGTLVAILAGTAVALSFGTDEA